MSSRKTPEISPRRLLQPKLSLAVQYASTVQNLPTRAQLRRWVKAALQRDASMTLRVVDEAEGRKLNKSFRGKDYATNVLTFVYDDAETIRQPARLDKLGAGLSGEAVLYGDVVICAPVAEREAAKQHKDLFAHYAHLVVHAALHLQGYDHENAADADEMETLETAIMLKLHQPDPYQ